FRKGQNEMVSPPRYTCLFLTILLAYNRPQIRLEGSEYPVRSEIRSGRWRYLNESFFRLHWDICRLWGRLRPLGLLLEGQSKEKDEKDHEEKEQITKGQQPEIVSFLCPGFFALRT
ncbi:MAG: hypothetical protein ABSF48_26515, partial [Thermodesulfobacteriota bacterium]